VNATQAVVDLDDAEGLLAADREGLLRAASMAGAQVRATAAALDEGDLDALKSDQPPRTVVWVAGRGNAETAGTMLSATLGGSVAAPIVVASEVPPWIGALDVLILAGDDSGDPAQGTVGHLIGDQAVSHISMSAGVTRDVWTAIAPNITTPALQRIVTVGNRTLPPEAAGVAIAYLARAYLKNPPPAQFHLIVSPLVMWIWVGGIIVFGGGLIAIWPAPSAVRRRVGVRSRARAAQRLARA